MDGFDIFGLDAGVASRLADIASPSHGGLSHEQRVEAVKRLAKKDPEQLVHFIRHAAIREMHMRYMIARGHYPPAQCRSCGRVVGCICDKGETR